MKSPPAEGMGSHPDRREGGLPLAAEAARLLDRLRAEPLPAEPWAAAALRRATQAAFAILDHVRRLAKPATHQPKDTP